VTLTRAALLLVAPLLIGAAGPRLVPDVSDRQIQIAYSFTGADLLLFGAILYPHGETPAPGADPTDIIVVVKGPSQSVTVRGKKQVAGIWVNSGRMRYRTAPAFYAIASSRPVEDLLDARTRAIYELGLDSLQLSPASNDPIAVQQRFSQGLVDLRQREGLYSDQPDAVDITDSVLYRARIAIPARVAVGRYTAETFLVRDHRVLAVAVRDVDIRKSGFERFVARAAQRHPVRYGLAAVALAVALGWAAGWIAGRR
jgi:uncharacterized protein (TIGR02186 family)